MTPRELILNAAGRLREAGVPNPLEDSAFLLSSLCHQPPLNLRMDMETVLSQDILMKYDALLQRRGGVQPHRAEHRVVAVPRHQDDAVAAQDAREDLHSDPMDCSLPGSAVQGTVQARVLEWGAIAFSVITVTSSKYISLF